MQNLYILKKNSESSHKILMLMIQRKDIEK